MLRALVMMLGPADFGEDTADFLGRGARDFSTSIGAGLGLAAAAGLAAEPPAGGRAVSRIFLDRAWNYSMD